MPRRKKNNVDKMLDEGLPVVQRNIGAKICQAARVAVLNGSVALASVVATVTGPANTWSFQMSGDFRRVHS